MGMGGGGGHRGVRKGGGRWGGSHSCHNKKGKERKGASARQKRVAGLKSSSRTIVRRLSCCNDAGGEKKDSAEFPVRLQAASASAATTAHALFVIV